jgi:hypothetical protein
MADGDVRQQPGPTYLGDGVYASFDGYQIWLHLGAHDAEPLIAIEAAVLHTLIGYAQTCGMKAER